MSAEQEQKLTPEQELAIERKQHRQTGERLKAAEEILCYLCTEYWFYVLNKNDNPISEDRVGNRILNYWKEWNGK